MRSTIGRVLVAGMLLAAGRAGAVELLDGKLALNGFGTWRYGIASANSYMQGTTDGAYLPPSFALATIAKPVEQLTLAGQVMFNQSGTTVDWLFGEWRFSDRIRFRVGAVRQPFGLYNEIHDVGTLQPFLTLPMIYHSVGFAGESINGAGINGAFYASSGWGLGYDIYAGSMGLLVRTIPDKLNEPDTLKPHGKSSRVSEEAKNLVGGRLSLFTPIDGLFFRLSGYGTRTNISPTSVEAKVAVAGSAEYLDDRWSVRAEAATLWDTGEGTKTAYVELARYVTQHVQVAVRGELARLTAAHYTGDSPLQDDRELALGLSYWFTPGFVVRGSYHFINGNLNAPPTSVDDALLENKYQPTTHALLAGTQFSF